MKNITNKKYLYSFLELDIGQVYENIYLKEFCIKLSRTMYFSLSKNYLSRMTPEFLHSPSKNYLKCSFNIGKELNRDYYSEGYTESTLLFADEIKKFINTHEQTLHTDFSRGYQTALVDLVAYFKWRGVITDENFNQDTV